MPQAIVYCDRCARLITPGEVNQGNVLYRDGVSICATCLQKMPDAERKQLGSSRTGSTPVPQTGSKKISTRSARPVQPQAATRTAPVMGVAMVVAGLLIGIVFALLVLPAGEEDPAPATTARPVVSVAGPVVVPSAPPVETDAETHEPPVPAAEQRLSALRARLEPSLQNYTVSRAALVKLCGEYNNPDAEPAKTLLDELDAQYAEVADRALEAAITETVTMAARREFDEAEAAMKDLGPRFAEGPWLAATGQKRIDATLADVARMRTLSAEADAKAKADAEERERQAKLAAQKPPEAPAERAPDAPEGVADNALWTEPGAFLTKISKSDLDDSALAEWVDGSERRITDIKVENIFWTRDGKVEWRGVEFGRSTAAGMRHLRIGFKKPVVVASVVTNLEPDIEVSVLREDASYPGDLEEDGQWRSAWRPRPANASVWVLPPGTTTRALRFSCSRTPGDKEEMGKYHGAIVLSHAVTNVGTDARAAASHDKRVSLINDGNHGWFADTNWLSNHAARSDTVSRDKPEWVTLTWPETVLLRGLNVLDAGFKSVDVFIYNKDGDPSGPGDDDWISVGTFAARCRYPSIIGPNWIDFGSVREVKAVKLVITDAHRTNELHPHRREGYCYEGKCVWLGEVLALKPFADSPLLPLIRRVGELGERTKADPATDGFLLNPEIIYAVAKAHDPEKVKARSIASVGGAVAASSNFDRSLLASLKGSAGYSFPSRSGVARSRMSVRALLKGLDRYLTRNKPEVVRICFDAGSLQRVADPKSLAPGIRDVVKRIQSAGAVPVLFTLPAPQFRDEKAQALVAAYDEMIVAAAAELRVPYIDARALLNRNAKKHFSRNGALRTQAYVTMNAAFHNLYWTLEASLFARAEIPKAVATKKVAKKTEQKEADPQEPDRQEPRQKEPDRQAAPPPPPAAAPRASSVVTNGGFEKRDERTRFATGWRKHVWGEPDNTASIRLDRTNPHTGDCAVSVRARRDGAKPGAYAGVKLEPGTYEVSYWAQADVEERAQVGGHLGGVDLTVQTVGEEWTQVTERIEIEKRSAAASLKLWVQTQNVRVWFDDVQVRLIRAKTD